MDNQQFAEDLRAIIESETGHLNRYVRHGDRVSAHEAVDAIIDATRKLEDMTGERPQYEPPPWDNDPSRSGPTT